MAAELRLAPEAGQDLAEAYGWYERRRPGLGEELLGCIEACIQGICRAPSLYPAVHENFRRALVRRFPYAIFYEHADNVVTIYGILHTSRDPDRWRQRLA